MKKITFRLWNKKKIEQKVIFELYNLEVKKKKTFFK